MGPVDLSTIGDLPAEVELDGRKFVLHQLRLADFGAAEQHIKSNRLAQFLHETRAVLMAPDMKAQAMAQIVCQRVDFGETLVSPKGRTFLLYRALLRGDPTITIKFVEELPDVTFSMLSDLVDLASGIKPEPSGGDGQAPLGVTSTPTGTIPIGPGSSEPSAPAST